MDYQEILFLIGRAIFGGYFVMMSMNHFMKSDMLSGYASSKGVPSSRVAVFLTGLLLLAGGLGVLLGAYIQWAVFSLAVFLLGVSFKMHAFWTEYPDPNMKMTDMVNFMKNMALLGASLMLLAIPEPWAYALF